MTANENPNRQQRRAAAARAARARPIRPALPVTNPLLARAGNAAAHSAEALSARLLGLKPQTRLDLPIIMVGDQDLREVGVWATAAVVIPIFAQWLLKAEGVHTQLVAGAAMWSVGPGADDTLDHGVAGRPVSSVAATEAIDYHLWLESEDQLIDFAGRYLPYKFGAAHRRAPFSTRPAFWRRFPATIVHDLARPMSDPISDAAAPYGYWTGGNDLLEHVRRDLAHRIPEVRPLL